MSLTLAATRPAPAAPVAPAAAPDLLGHLAGRVLSALRDGSSDPSALAALLPEILRVRAAALAALAMAPALDRLGRGVAVLGADLRVVAVNDELRSLLPAACGFSDMGGRLILGCPQADRALAIALGAAQATAEGRIALLPDATAFAFARPDGCLLAAQVRPLPACPGGAFAGALLLVSDPARRAAATPLLLQRTLGLEAADAHLLAAVMRGESVPCYARRQHQTPAAVKRRLSKLCRRLGCRSPMQLAALVGRLC